MTWLRRLSLGFVAPALVLVAGPARAQDPFLVEKLAPEIAKACLPPTLLQRASLQDESGVISAQALGTAIFASGIAPLHQEYQWNAGGPAAIARQAFADDAGPNADSLNRLQSLISTWIAPDDGGSAWLPLASGGVSVRRADGSPATARDGEAVLADILAGNAGRFVFGCRHVPASDDAPEMEEDDAADETDRRPVFAVAKTPDDLALALADKSFAEFAYLEDREADSQTYSAYVTLGLIWPERAHPSPTWTTSRFGWLVRARPGLFVQYEREGSDTTPDVDETNNLNFGLQAAGFLQTRGAARGATTRTHYFAFGARYLTDDQFESEGWSVLARVTPGLRWPGFQTPQDLTDRLQYRWLVSGIADYESIEDPGDKASLQDSPEFGRLGFDADAELRLFLTPDREQAISLSASYAMRADVTGADGDADLFTSRLLFEPSPHYSFGIVYERGENLESLEAIEQWKLTVGIRR